MQMSTRGIRNCNPGNLRKSKDNWRGLRKERTDKEFFQFVTPEYGYRAMIITIRNYNRRYGLNTVSKIINRYAPPIENHTDKYINYVAREMRVDPNEVIDTNDEATMVEMVCAMSFVENGKKAIRCEVERGWELSLS